MIRFTELRLRLRKGQEGVALVVVIAISSILLVLVTVAVSTALSGVVKARTDQSWNSAIAAAYAGIEDYKSKISNNSSYYRYGNPAAPFSSTSSVTLPTGTEFNPAFGTGPLVGTKGTWQEIRNSDGRAWYRYEVDNSKYASSGVLRIRATGKVGNEVRSVVANLRQSGFIDFLYYTTYEIQDPAISGSPNSCVKYAWQSRSTSGCGDISFAGADIIDGPMHSNDRIRVCGPATFKGLVTTSYNPATGVKYAKMNASGSTTGCTGEDFQMGKPQYTATIDMPPTNTAMINEVRTDIPDDVPRPGCLYTGPTSITFNNDGTMTVRSPWTLKTRVAGSPNTSGSDNADCGLTGTGTNQLGSAGGAKVDVPEQNLIYIQNVPISNSGPNPNRRTSSSYPSGYNSTVCNNGNGIGFPASGESISNVTTNYGCRNGDLFVKGTLKGQLTIAAENFVYITGDIKYASADNDVLGLVGNNAAFVWNPINGSGNAMLGTDRRIDAAILSVAHTFQVQNYNKANYRGELTVNGAIAQKFRGPVATGNATSLSTGYAKDYHYDPRFRYIAPPKFLTPVTTTYGISVVVEVKTAYNPDGSAIL